MKKFKGDVVGDNDVDEFKEQPVEPSLLQHAPFDAQDIFYQVIAIGRISLNLERWGTEGAPTGFALNQPNHNPNPSRQRLERRQAFTPQPVRKLVAVAEPE